MHGVTFIILLNEAKCLLEDRELVHDKMSYMYVCIHEERKEDKMNKYD